MREDDRGTGLFGSIAGVLVFLAFLLFAVQLLFNLYATSVVTSVAYDSARIVATSGIDFTNATDLNQEKADAEQHARDLLGKYAARVTFAWTGTTDSVVRLSVHAQNPHFLLPVLGGTVGFDTIDRTVTVRVEKFR
jgi:hypothetical protein